jgi:undecaprenyl-diphosphatase
MTTDDGGIHPEPFAEIMARLRDRGASAHGDGEELLDEVGRLDREIYGAIADTPTPKMDEPLRRLSNAANFSRLWIGIAGGLALVGGRRGRRAAVTGLVAIGITSAFVNQGVKRLYPRERPDREGEDVPETRLVRMPDSTSFPSGHSASGFAFATAVGTQLPVVGAGLRFLAGAVAYSRVHTGVHYPGDAVVGSLIGAGIGSIVGAAGRRRGPQ